MRFVSRTSAISAEIRGARIDAQMRSARVTSAVSGFLQRNLACLGGEVK